MTHRTRFDVSTIVFRAGMAIADALNSPNTPDLAGSAARRDTGWVKLRQSRA